MHKTEASTLATESDVRQEKLIAWLKQVVLPIDYTALMPLNGDASFRRYFRVFTKTSATFIAMDSPGDKEDNPRFIQVANYLHRHNITVPQIVAKDMAQGFLLLTDFGDDVYLNRLREADSTQASKLYASALDTLTAIQACPPPADNCLPPYNTDLLMGELGLFKAWFLEKDRHIQLDHQEDVQLTALCQHLTQSALAQPHVCVHRDYHSRNLMYLSHNDDIGVLDFQDAVWGPITYDLVSLLRDCYIEWPQPFIDKQVTFFYERTKEATDTLTSISLAEFTRWFDWMGVQRHLKVLGIFTRLYQRDGKAAYLNDLPRVYDYLITVSARYPELHWLSHFLNNRIDKEQLSQR